MPSGAQACLAAAGSRSALDVGNSVAVSAASARRQLLERAAEALEAAPEDIDVGSEGAAVRGAPSRSMPLESLVGQGLEAIESWSSNGPAWASSCHVAVVRLHLETGGSRCSATSSPTTLAERSTRCSSTASPPDLAAEPELIHTETPTGQNPEDFGGAGEAGTIAVSAAVANAVEDALCAAGRPGEVEMVPVTPLRLWQLLSKGA